MVESVKIVRYVFLRRFEEIFEAYVAAHSSHWKTPPMEPVERKLTQGKFTHRAGSDQFWSTELECTVKDDYVIVDLLVNASLPDSMQSKSQTIRAAFLQTLASMF